MSDQHDHSQHDHDHQHDHGHDHTHATPSVPPQPPTGGAPDDAGSQALADALKSSFGIVRLVMVVLVVLFFVKGIFIVGPQEKAIVLRFGKPLGVGAEALKGPGFYWAMPYPIDEVVRIPISEVQKVTSTVGWYFTTPEMEYNNTEPIPGASLNPAQDGYVITGDQNIVHTRATLNYRIEDPIRFVFSFVNASNAVQSALDNSLLRVAAGYKVDDLLARDIQGFQERVQARVAEIARVNNLGIVVEQCRVESRPPRQVRGSFEQVNTALSLRESAKNQALTYKNQTISRAEAESESRTNSAQAERVRLVELVKADAQQFTDLLPKFEANPMLFKSILLNEKIGQVLTNVQDKWVMPPGTGKNRELRLDLTREPKKAPNQ